MIFDEIMLDKLKNSDISIHLKNGYESSFNKDRYEKYIVSGVFKFYTDKFICIQNNIKIDREDKKLKPFFIFLNIDNIIAIEIIPHEDE